MLVLAALLVALLAVPLLGGRWSGLADLTLRRKSLAVSALLVQVLAISIVPTWPRPLLVALHAVSYVFAAAFLWANRRLPGILLVGLGGGLNAGCIALNGGTLPADPDALRKAGLVLDRDEFVNSGVVHDPVLPWLGDVFASPSWLPLHNVYSVGDLVILAGALWAVNRACRTVLVRDPRPALTRALARLLTTGGQPAGPLPRRRDRRALAR